VFPEAGSGIGSEFPLPAWHAAAVQENIIRTTKNSRTCALILDIDMGWIFFPHNEISMVIEL
jgi:hypothetical protein